MQKWNSLSPEVLCFSFAGLFHAQLCDRPQPAQWQFPAVVPWGQLLAPSARVTCGHWLLPHLPLFSLFQGTSCVLFLLQSPFCTWSEKPQWDGRRLAVVQFISPKNRYNSEILLTSVYIAPKGRVELFKRHFCHWWWWWRQRRTIFTSDSSFEGLVCSLGFFYSRDYRSWGDKKHFCGFPSVDLREK